MANFDEINPQSTIDGIIKLNKELQNTNTTVAALLLENEKLKKQFEDIGASTKSVSEKSTAYQKILSDTEKEQVKINASAKEMQRQEQALIAAEAKLIEANSAANKALIEKQIQIKKTNAAIIEEITGSKAATEAAKAKSAADKVAAAEAKARSKEEVAAAKAREKADSEAAKAKARADNEAAKAAKIQAKANEAEEGSLNRMRQRLAELTKAYDNSGVRTKEAAKEILTLSNNISAAEAETGRFSRGVGDYRNKLGNLTKGLMDGSMSMGQFTKGIVQMGKQALAFLATPVGMIVAAVTGIALVGKALIQNAQEFDKASSSLSAVTGAVGEDLVCLNSCC